MTYWAFEAFNKDNPDLSRVNDPENAFSEGLKRTESFQNRLKINTPDPVPECHGPSFCSCC